MCFAMWCVSVECAFVCFGGALLALFRSERVAFARLCMVCTANKLCATRYSNWRLFALFLLFFSCSSPVSHSPICFLRCSYEYIAVDRRRCNEKIFEKGQRIYFSVDKNWHMSIFIRLELRSTHVHICACEWVSKHITNTTLCCDWRNREWENDSSLILLEEFHLFLLTMFAILFGWQWPILGRFTRPRTPRTRIHKWHVYFTWPNAF